MKRTLLRRDNIRKEEIHKLNHLERCIFCDHCWGFRSKIPQCRAERCIYEQLDLMDDE